MASVIRFGTIALPKAATSISSFYQVHQNLISGHYEPAYAVLDKNRNIFCNTSLVRTANYLNYNMGTTANRTVDYFAVIRADRLIPEQNRNLRLTLYSDDNGAGTYTLRNQITFTNSAPRHSPRNTDVISEYSPVTTNHRFWAPHVTTDSGSGSYKWQFTQFYFGQLFDIGSDPEDFTARKDNRTGQALSENGTLITAEPEYSPIEFTISWMGITDAKAEALENLVEEANNYGIILYCTNTQLTDGYSMCHCDSMEVEKEKLWTNYNSVTVKLKEIL
jgi:hypothetical protein